MSMLGAAVSFARPKHVQAACGRGAEPAEPEPAGAGRSPRLAGAGAVNGGGPMSTAAGER